MQNLMQNREMRELEENLLSVLNASPVLIEAKRYVLLSVLRIVEKEADKAIFEELNQPIVEKGNLNNAEST